MNAKEAALLTWASKPDIEAKQFKKSYKEAIRTIALYAKKGKGYIDNVFINSCFRTKGVADELRKNGYYVYFGDTNRLRFRIIIAWVEEDIKRFKAELGEYLL